MVPAPEESMVVLPPMSPTKLSWKATIGARVCAGWVLNEMGLFPTVLPWVSITTKVAPVMLSSASFNRVMMIWNPVGSVLLGRLASHSSMKIIHSCLLCQLFTTHVRLGELLGMSSTTYCCAPSYSPLAEYALI